MTDKAALEARIAELDAAIKPLEDERDKLQRKLERIECEDSPWLAKLKAGHAIGRLWGSDEYLFWVEGMPEWIYPEDEEWEGLRALLDCPQVYEQGRGGPSNDFDLLHAK